jgi:hypothetical protein
MIELFYVHIILILIALALCGIGYEIKRIANELERRGKND